MEAAGPRLRDREPGEVTGDAAAYRTPAAPLRAIVEELVAAGVRDVIAGSGSRSLPLTLALRANRAVRLRIILDERAGAYFALGMAKASRQPVAIVGTSGTAVVNFAPAVVEAREGRVPLIVLTADRPPELHDRGAPQTIDQVHLYGRFAKWYAELPVPEEDPLLEAHLRGVVGRAVATAVEAPFGPVHLNLAFREPLVPDGDLRSDRAADRVPPPPHVSLEGGIRVVPEAGLDRLASSIAAARRPLIVCGPLDVPGFAAAVARLAMAAAAPILADGLAGLRFGRHDRSRVVARHDALLRSAEFRAGHLPDLVLRFGGTPTSKALVATLQEQRVAQIVVDDGGWTEPTLLPATMVHADPVRLAVALSERLEGRTPGEVRSEPAWCGDWLVADTAADRAIREWLEGLTEPFEGSAFTELEGRLPDGAIVYAGNSMPVRDLDAFMPSGETEIRCLANRGANGIDGTVSAALGAAAASSSPVVLVVGDLAFLHDLNALVAARSNQISATIVLVNNDGGGIFSFLPQASTRRPEVGLPDHFEELFGTPQGIEPGPVVVALGAGHRLVGARQIGPAVTESIGRQGVQVLELRTDRSRNVELHHACHAAVAQALRELPAARSWSPG